MVVALGLAYVVAFIYSLIHKRRVKRKRIQKIAAVWYTPLDLSGSNLRLGQWKEFFEKEGYQFDNFYVGSTDEYNHFDRGGWSVKYDYHRIYLLRRLKQFFALKDYDVVWIARGFVIGYPLQHAFFERCIKRMVGHLVVDSTDGGDYRANPELVLDTMRQADRITVGFVYLKQFFSRHFDDIVQFNWTIPQDNYIIKSDYEIAEERLPIIGWMGSPVNFGHVKAIESELNRVAQDKPFKFVYLCREEQDLHLPNAVVEYHNFGEDYAELLASFDVGIAPCFGETITQKGKIAMKHLEFLLCAVPQVCSNIAISEFVEDGRDVLIANDVADWQPQLHRILGEAELRKSLGENSRSVYQGHYTYESEWAKVRDALTKF